MPCSTRAHSRTLDKKDSISCWIALFEYAILSMKMIEWDEERPGLAHLDPLLLTPFVQFLNSPLATQRAMLHPKL
jgi:hypothetical protein